MRAFAQVRKWTTVGLSAIAAGCSGCAVELPTPATANRYQVGRWRGLDVDEAGRALALRLNTPPSALARHVEYAVVPVMPAAAIVAGTVGMVDVQWRIARDGTVLDATVIGTPPAPLALAALAAVKRWRFAPGTTEFCCVVQRFEFATLASEPHPDRADAASQ